MRNIILVTVFTLVTAVFYNANAQETYGDPVTAKTTVNINLSNVISIDAESSLASGGTVDFNFLTADDYNNGIAITVANSLIVTSTTDFSLSVKSEGAHFDKTGANGIPVSILSIKNVSNTESTPVILSTTNQTIVPRSKFGSLKSFDLEYEIPGTQAIAHLFGRSAGTYTQTITYIATAL